MFHGGFCGTICFGFYKNQTNLSAENGLLYIWEAAFRK